MVAVVGNIQAQDDYTHPLGPEDNFNESMYFNFFDHARGYGGFLRCGNRANEGYAEVTLCLFLPGGEVLFNYQRPKITSNKAMDAGGLRFEVLEPLLRHRADRFVRDIEAHEFLRVLTKGLTRIGHLLRLRQEQRAFLIRRPVSQKRL